MSAAPRWPYDDRCMICVSLAAPSVEELHHRIAELAGADLVEVRLDALDDPDALDGTELEGIVARSPVPAGFTVRPRWHGGGYRGDEDDRRALLLEAAAAGAAFIDVELDAEWAAHAIEEARCPVIVSHHWEQSNPADLDERVERLMAMRPSVGKLVAVAETPTDALPLLRAGERLVAAGQPATCFCMGAGGKASRLLAAGRGAALIYAAPRAEHEVAPGQWSLRQLTDVFRLPGWQAGLDFCGLIGHPIGHSLSPAIFNAVFQERGVPLAYVLLPGEQLEPNLELAEAVGFRGLSVTMPFKEPVARRCARLDPLAENIGAVNTVIAGPDGWVGYNTDGPAVVQSLAERLELDGAEVAIVGAGGAARAAAVALSEAGAELTVLNRTLSKAEEIAELVGGSAGSPELLEQRRFAAIINATPLGMPGGGLRDQTPVPRDWLHGTEVVFDMVYRPRRTRLLAEAEARGCTTVEGLEMFVRQAAAQYRLLTGNSGDQPLDALGAVAEAALVDD